MTVPCGWFWLVFALHLLTHNSILVTQRDSFHVLNHQWRRRMSTAWLMQTESKSLFSQVLVCLVLTRSQTHWLFVITATKVIEEQHCRLYSTYRLCLFRCARFNLHISHKQRRLSFICSTQKIVYQMRFWYNISRHRLHQIYIKYLWWAKSSNHYKGHNIPL